MRTRTAWVRRLGWAGTLVVLAVFGHDALMVAVAHGADRPGGDQPRPTAHAGADEHVGDEHLDVRRGEPSQDHPAGCGVARAVARPTADDADRWPAATALPAGAAPGAALPTQVRARCAEPTASPGVRRALLRVYRL